MWVKNRYPKWSPVSGNMVQNLRSPVRLNFDPHPCKELRSRRHPFMAGTSQTNFHLTRVWIVAQVRTMFRVKATITPVTQVTTMVALTF